jgi:hypothetical protein
MNINEFAGYLANGHTNKAEELYDDLDSNISFYDVDDRILHLIANGYSYNNERYDYGELLEWLDNDRDSYANVNAVLNSSYTDFHTLLETARHNQDKEQYDEMYSELETLLADFDGDDELDNDEVTDQDTPKTYESILDAL